MRGVIDVETIKQFIKDIPLNILDTSATLLMFKDNPRIASKVLNDIHRVLNERERLLDLGCGYGYLTKLFMNLLGLREGYCSDLSEERL
jgi:predicted RNA methylase